MPEEPFLINLGISRREFLTIFVLIVNAFTWYFVVFGVLKEILNSVDMMPYEIAMVWSVHFIGVAGATLLGAILPNRVISRNNLLTVWMLFGVISSIIPVFVGTTHIVSISVISFIFGVSFGFGMPSCMGYYSDSTVTENRGRLGGFVYFGMGVGLFLLRMIAMPSLIVELTVLTIWRGFGLTAFLFLKPRKEHTKSLKTPSYISILRRRPFLLYFVPWFMFSLIDCLTAPIFPPEIVRMSILIGSTIIGLFALVGGILSDLVGRKRVVIAGFVLLGTGYAMLGILPERLISYYFYTVVDSIAWGIFGAVFLIALWGDLSENMMPEKYYAIGGMPFLLSGFLERLVAPHISEIVSVYAVFSLASFFLFLAVLPLMYAPETLPEKKIQLRKLRKYVEEAKKKVEKGHQKTEQ
jgi:hypothetical protein